MDVVITKKEKRKIMILGAFAGIFGAVSGSIGLYMKTQLTSSKLDWGIEGIPELTEGYFGVMSGFLLFLLGSVGYFLIYSRIFCLVFLYGFLSLSCDVLCVLDALMVMPYTKENGKFAWDKQGCNYFNSSSTSNHTGFTINTNLKDISDALVSCEDFKIIAILLICITTAVLIAFILSTITTFVTGVALCRAKNISASEEPGLQLSPFTLPNLFEATNYDNALNQNNGFKP